MRKIFFISTILFASCNRSDPPQPSNTAVQNNPVAGINEITYVNGACNYNNNTFSVAPTNAHYGVNVYYTSVEQFTAHNGLIVFTFPSQSTGTYILDNSTLGNIMQVQIMDSVGVCLWGDYFMPDSIVVNVSRYDGVGGLIEGVWGGRLKKNTDMTQKINATGKFSLIRGSDQ